MQRGPRLTVVGGDIHDVGLSVHVLASLRQEAGSRLQTFPEQLSSNQKSCLTHQASRQSSEQIMKNIYRGFLCKVNAAKTSDRTKRDKFSKYQNRCFTGSNFSQTRQTKDNLGLVGCSTNNVIAREFYKCVIGTKFMDVTIRIHSQKV